MTHPALEILDLKLQFRTISSVNTVLHGINVTINPRERVALVGESGSGKSVTARLILGLLQEQKGVVTQGLIRFYGEDLQALPDLKREALRGREISMIFQDPTSSLNPVFTIAALFHEVLARRQTGISLKQANAKAIELLTEVSIQDPQRVLDSYAFQLSGGLNQRIMIAMALANQPKLLIADEPGTALDVSVQAQTLRLMRDMVTQYGTAVLFISHNLGVVREFADRVYVIYQGRIVESGTTEQIYQSPRHAYTQALLAAVPRLTGDGLSDVADDVSRYQEPAFHHQPTAVPS
ncbi:MAG TPA: dipeptide/oligopeptide/nickel ABC transporter ATP-binding protein [Oceanospirillaceae bacterium]|nr:dipeptide/oligopeptide/nickel ABC transporter ATP-binding protein [Oceanospirillaceae bacterium]